MENYKNIQPLSEFDWEAFEKGTVEGGESHKEQSRGAIMSLGFPAIMFCLFSPTDGGISNRTMVLR